VATEILPVRSKRWTHTISNVTSNFWWFVVTKTFREMAEVIQLYIYIFHEISILFMKYLGELAHLQLFIVKIFNFNYLYILLYKI